MKVLRLDVIVFLSVIGFHNWNVVCGKDEVPDQDGANTKPEDANPSPPDKTATTNSSISTDTADQSPITLTCSTTTAISEVLVTPPNDEIPKQYAKKGEDEQKMLEIEEKLEETRQLKKAVAELITKNWSNNSFILKSLFNISSTKPLVQFIGDPFDFSYIVNLEFMQQSIGFENSDKMTNFSNIRAVNSSAETVTSYYNNFTCTSQGFEVAINVIPENMNFKGDYLVQDKSVWNNTSNGSFIFKQTGAKLIYKFSNISEVYDKDSSKIMKHGDLIYTNGTMKFTQLCDNQCDLLASSAQMFANAKSHILKKFPNTSQITTRIDQFISVFPFLSTCTSSQRPSKRNFYIIKDSIAKEYKSSNLVLGPMMLDGLDNFTDGTVIAAKSRSSPLTFVISTQANHVQGQCDWRYEHRSSVNNYSFTFIIEEVHFFARVSFSDSWNVHELRATVGKIVVHRLDKSCPKIIDFTASILQEFVREAVANSLEELFHKEFPDLGTTPGVPSKKTKKTESRAVVYWTKPILGDETEASTRRRTHLPFPTRKVFTACKDTRRWWQKLFYKNKCVNRYNDEE